VIPCFAILVHTGNNVSHIILWASEGVLENDQALSGFLWFMAGLFASSAATPRALRMSTSSIVHSEDPWKGGSVARNDAKCLFVTGAKRLETLVLLWQPGTTPS